MFDNDILELLKNGVVIRIEKSISDYIWDLIFFIIRIFVVLSFIFLFFLLLNVDLNSLLIF